MKRIIFLAMIFFAFKISAQRTCGSMEMYLEQLKNNTEMQKNRNFQERHTSNFKLRDDNVITIPVVFHIIHDGDAVGTDENISDALIMANLEQLNDDYAKINADAGFVPSAFTGLAADTKIQFCLAERTPDCLASTGIYRYNMGVYEWDNAEIENILKPATIWDSDLYLNVWTVRFGGGASGLLGYAQFPGGPSATDGVVVTYQSVGSLDLENPAGWNYGNGRTMTHEVGHYLNLLHIWGDDEGEPDECSGSDLVADTPNQQISNAGCPSFPHITCSNGPNGDMFMNYMDYVDDQCMFMFSNGQKTRMRAVLEGGLRNSLSSSPGCSPPDPLTCYCSAGASSSSYEKISNVTFSGINNNSSSTAGYENFMNLTANVNRGQTYPFSSSISGLDEDDLLVWIDFNRDGDFSDIGEEVINTTLTSSSYNGNISVPVSASTGSTGMRIRLHYTPFGGNDTPCGLSSYGQVEDYLVQISSALPVNILSFVVVKKDNDINVNWQVENSKDVDFYDIEIGDANKMDFARIVSIKSYGLKDFSYIIKNVHDGTFVVRLKIFDKNGNFSYSPVKTINLNSDKMYIYPNPVFEKLNIYGENTNDIRTIEIIDQFGRTVKSASFNSEDKIAFNTTNLNCGIYFLKVNKNNGSEFFKFIKCKE